jgi:hypothetical protein
MLPCGVRPGEEERERAGGRRPGAAPAPAPTKAPPAPTTAPTPAAPTGPRGSISDFSISTVKRGVVWSGSSTGQIYNTLDGSEHWNNVTNFPDIPANVNMNWVGVEAGHNDVNTAYVVGNLGFGRGGPPPSGPEQHYVYRTHDGGQTWTKIVNGLPTDERTGSRVNVIREDPKQKGLLFAGTETTVYVSFDDGDHWQSLRQNLPSTSIRDMVFHTNDNMNDLVICTYGRGFWVLDDMSPLREVAAKARAIETAPAYLFKPGDALRARENGNWDQPMNPEVPHAENAPFGVLVYYHLSKKPTGDIKLQMFDSAGKLVRTMTSVLPSKFERPPYPDYWLKSPEERALSTNIGTNRTNWDLRYDDPPGFNPDINNQMNSAPNSVTPGPHGPLVLPGTYTLKLTVDGTTYTQSVVVRNDPRVGEKVTIGDLRAQNRLALSAWSGMKDSFAANGEVAAVRAQLATLMKSTLPPDVQAAATALDTKLAGFGSADGRGPGRSGFGGGFGAPARAPGSVLPFYTINTLYYTVLGPLSQNGLDMPPTPAQIDTLETACKEYSATGNGWKTMLTADLVEFNNLLTKNNLPPLKVMPTAVTAPASCKWAAASSGGRK